jgi:hypothetical protein
MKKIFVLMYSLFVFLLLPSCAFMSDQALAKNKATVKSSYSKSDEKLNISTSCNYVNSVGAGRVCLDLGLVSEKESLNYYLVVSRESDHAKMEINRGSQIWISVDGAAPFKLNSLIPGSSNIKRTVHVYSWGKTENPMEDVHKERVVFLIPFPVIEKMAFSEKVDIEIQGKSDSSIKASFNKKNFEIFKEFCNKAKSTLDANKK